jgi:hypothetical protein
LAVDDSSLLPKAPPPPPARRDAAVEAALRRFDGIEEPTMAEPGRRSRPESAWAWGKHPQFGLAMSAAVIAVIGLPAALIAIRDSGVAPREAAAPAAEQPTFEAADVAEQALSASSQPEPSRDPPARDPAARPQPDRRGGLPDEVSDRAPFSPPVPAYEPQAAPAAASPPPPAPPLPPPRAEQQGALAESDEGSIVVTGSQIRAPNAWAERVRDGRGKAGSQRNNDVSGTAPDWVLKDLGYRRFLNQLQGAVRSNDRAAVTRLISYPLRVNSGGRATFYRNVRSVLADYDRIFTSRVRNAILTQRFENLFGRDQGVMIGDAAVWFDRTCRNTSCSPPGPVRIKAINP